MLIHLSHLGLIQVSGPDAKKLLQGQLTCDLEDVSATQCRLGAHCNPQGRMESLFRLFWYQDNYYLQMPLEVLEDALITLKKYAVFFKVQLEDATNKLVCVSGDETDLTPFFSTLPTQVDEIITVNDLLITKILGAQPHYEIIGTPAAIEHLRILATDVSANNAWKLHNIAAGLPTLYPETVGKLLPHEINLPQINGVSFKKGCFTGQEIIARMHYRGQLKKQMHRARVRTTTAPQPGADIYAEGPCGTIVDSCQEEADTYQILFVANQTDAINGQLFLDPDKAKPLEFIPLRY